MQEKKMNTNSRDPQSSRTYITEAEAIQLQWELIRKWKPKEDIRSFMYGPGILALGAGATGLYMNQFYRKIMKLKLHGRWVSILPSAVFPAMCSTIFHAQFITSDILIGKTLCPTCLETKAAIIQVGFGIAYPLIISPLLSYFLTSHYFTEVVPPVKEMGQHWWKISKPLFGKIPVIFLLHLVLVAFVVSREQFAMKKINTVIDSLEDHPS